MAGSVRKVSTYASQMERAARFRLFAMASSSSSSSSDFTLSAILAWLCENQQGDGGANSRVPVPGAFPVSQELRGGQYNEPHGDAFIRTAGFVCCNAL